MICVRLAKDEFHMISKGKGLNFIFTLNGHFLVEADGTVKVDFMHELAKCTGG